MRVNLSAAPSWVSHNQGGTAAHSIHQGGIAKVTRTLIPPGATTFRVNAETTRAPAERAVTRQHRTASARLQSITLSLCLGDAASIHFSAAVGMYAAGL